MILLIGVNSNIGRSLGQQLLANGEQVRVLVRSEASVAALRSKGYEVAIGNLAHPATLEIALEGIARVFLLTSPDQDAVDWHQHAIAAARKARVQHLVRSSLLGANPDSSTTFIRQHGISDRFLEDSGVPFTILRPNCFLQNITAATMPGIEAQGICYDSVGDARLSMVDTRDVAEVTATVLRSDVHLGKTYDLTGPWAFSYQDVAQQASLLLQRDIQQVRLSFVQTHEILRGLGISEWLSSAIVNLYQDYAISGEHGYVAQLSDTVEHLTGHPPRSLDALLQEYIATQAQ